MSAPGTTVEPFCNCTAVSAPVICPLSCLNDMWWQYLGESGPKLYPECTHLSLQCLLAVTASVAALLMPETPPEL